MYLQTITLILYLKEYLITKVEKIVCDSKMIEFREGLEINIRAE